MGLGMADAVILKLTDLDRIAVLPTSSILKYANRDSDVRSIGRDLGVDAILDGTVQRDGDRVRVTAVLIRVRDGKTIWSRKLEDRYTNIFALQDAISDQLARTLAPSIEGRAAENPPTRLTESPEAYEAYLLGFYFWSQRNQENLSKAINYLEQAVKKDDKFAKAHAVLADAYYLSFQDGYSLLSQSEALSKASASVERALAIDDAIAEAHLVKAGIAFAENRHDEADKEFNRALELNPRYAPAHLRYGYFLFFESKLDQSLSEMKRAAQLDPVSPTSHLGLAYVLVMARDFDGAIAENLKAIELQPNHTVARLNLAEAYILKKMFRQAEAELNKLDNSKSSVGRDRAYLYAMSGRIKEASRILAELKASKNYSAISYYDYAVVYAALGDKNSALDSLQKTNPTRGILAKLRFDPQLDVLRSDKRFAEIMQRPTMALRATK
jgi:TolB-like protein